MSTFKNVNLLKLNDIFNFYCIIFMYNVLNNNDKYEYFLNKINFLQVDHNHNAHNNNKRIPYFSSNRCQQDIINKLISLWNNLPNNIKNPKSEYV